MDWDTILFCVAGGGCAVGAAAYTAINIINVFDPKIKLWPDELQRISDLEAALLKEKQYLEGFGNMQRATRYQHVTAALDNLVASDYREKGFIRLSILNNAERTYYEHKLGIKHGN